MRTGVYAAPHPPRTPAGAHTGRQDRAPLPMRDGASAHRTAGVWCGVPWRGEAGTQHAHARRPPRTLCTRVAKSPLHKSSHGWALAISSLRFALPESSVLASPHRRTHVHALPTLSTAPMRAHLTRQPRAHAAARAAGRRETESARAAHVRAMFWKIPGPEQGRESLPHAPAPRAPRPRPCVRCARVRPHRARPDRPRLILRLTCPSRSHHRPLRSTHEPSRDLERHLAGFVWILIADMSNYTAISVRPAWSLIQ